MVNSRAESLFFKLRARLLRLLGDELIRDPNIDNLELVKNGHDADASYAKVAVLIVGNRRTGMIGISLP